MDLLITNARYAVTSNSANEILENVSIGITDGKISYIGADKPAAAKSYDAAGKLIAPGLINSHTHLGMSLLRGWSEGVNLQGFLELVWAAEGAIMDEATCELGTELGALEALLSGTTTTMDMYLNPVATHRGAVRVGLRHIAGPIFFDFPGLDGLQWHQRIERADKTGYAHRPLRNHRETVGHPINEFHQPQQRVHVVLRSTAQQGTGNQRGEA